MGDSYEILTVAGGGTLEHLTVGLGWDPARPKWFGRSMEIDLNVAALIFSADRLVDVVYHEQLSSADGAIRHGGDSLTGEGPGDDEVIGIDLTRLAPHVTAVVLLVTCYTGQKLDEVENAFCRLVNGASGTEVKRYELSDLPYPGLVVGVLFRDADTWGFREIAAGIAARHPVEAAPLLGPYLQ
ncbi:TerD family protein [Nocardia sp. SYP-A9097]|uniref:TerD family protein n=1 Tax=Nocardia sp. SYP-A9097 TaxID=2663237 RepID=UPI0028168F44|nr:TerD family protein [Nocardia sp. SYP-A9097]